MRLKPTSPELLDALRNALRDLETVRTVEQGDPTLTELKRTIRAKIAEIENSKPVRPVRRTSQSSHA